MKVGHISVDDMRNGQQAKDTPDEGVPNTLTADDIQARRLGRRRSDPKVWDRRPGDDE